PRRVRRRPVGPARRPRGRTPRRDRRRRQTRGPRADRRPPRADQQSETSPDGPALGRHRETPLLRPGQRRTPRPLTDQLMAGSLMFTGSAAATTVVGNNCAATRTGVSVTAIALKNPPGYPLPSAIPSMGVITKWTFSIGAPLPPETLVEEKLKVFAPTGLPNQFKVAGESALAPVGAGLTTIPTRLEVQSGDLLGSTTIATISGKTGQFALYCESENEGDEIALLPGDPGT